MTIDKALTVDLNRVQPHKIIKIHEGDVNSVFLVLTVTKDGETVSLSNLTIKYDATIAGYLAEQDASGSISSNTIRIPITKNMTALPGTLKIDVKLKSGNEVLYTQTITMIVEKSVIDNGTIIDFDGTTIGSRMNELEAGFLDVKTVVRTLNAKFPIEADDIAANQVIKVKSISNDDATVNAAVDNFTAYSVLLEGRSNLMFCVNSGSNLRAQVRFDTLGYMKYRSQTKHGDAWDNWTDWSPIASGMNMANGAVSTAKIADGAVTTIKIAGKAVTSEKLANGAVAAVNIQAGCITANELAAGAVGSTELANGAVTTDKLANKAVTVTKIADKAVGTDQIALNAVTESKIADNAVTEAKIADGAVTLDKIPNEEITADKLAPGSVTTAKIEYNAVTSDEIADGAVTRLKLASGAVGSSQIGQGAIGPAHLTDGCVDTDAIDNGAVTTTELADGAVTADKIATGAVTASKLANDSVIENKIENNAVTTAKIKSGAITTGKLDDDAVTDEKLHSEAVITSKIKDAAVTTAKLANGAVTAAKIASGIIPSKTSELTNDSGFVSDLSDYMKLAHTTTSEDSGQFYLERVGLSQDAVNLYLAMYNDESKRVAWYSDLPDVSGLMLFAPRVNTGSEISALHTGQIFLYQSEVCIKTDDSYIHLPRYDQMPTRTSQLTNDSGFLTAHQDISGKANIESGTVPSNHAWYTDESSGYTMTGNYTIIGDMCFLRATAYLIQGWARVYYSLPVAATASGATIALQSDDTYSIATGTQSNISVLEIKKIGSSSMGSGTINFTLVYKCR